MKKKTAKVELLLCGLLLLLLTGSSYHCPFHGVPYTGAVDSVDLGAHDLTAANIATAGLVDGIDIATDVAANTTHSGSDGKNHSDVVTNNAKVSSPIANYDYIKVSEVQNQNTDAGTFTSGAWQTRVVNTEDNDTGGICAINANQITLEAGTYLCHIIVPAFSVDRHQAVFFNVTDGQEVIRGTSGFAVAADSVSHPSVIVGLFTIAAQKTFDVRHKCQTTKAGSGFGEGADVGAEVYTIAEFWRITP